jgi:hypothetical protein
MKPVKKFCGLRNSAAVSKPVTGTACSSDKGDIGEEEVSLVTSCEKETVLLSAGLASRFAPASNSGSRPAVNTTRLGGRVVLGGTQVFGALLLCRMRAVKIRNAR